MKRKIYCCGCTAKVVARLTNGSEIYPHRRTFQDIPFWICDVCGNYVGCHKKAKNRTLQLGCIPTPEIKKAKQHIHRILDPIWQSGKIPRKKLYEILTEKIGSPLNTAKIRSLEEAIKIYQVVYDFNREQITT